MNRKEQIFSDFVNNKKIPNVENIIILDNIQLKNNHISKLSKMYNKVIYVNSFNREINLEGFKNVEQIQRETLLKDYITEFDTLVVSFHFIQSLSSISLQNFLDSFELWNTDTNVYFYIEDYNCKGESQIAFDIIYITEILNDKSLNMNYNDILNLGGTVYYSKDDIIDALIINGFNEKSTNEKSEIFQILVKFERDYTDMYSIPAPKNTLYTLKNGNIYDWLKNQPSEVVLKKVINHMMRFSNQSKKNIMNVLWQVNSDESFFSQIF